MLFVIVGASNRHGLSLDLGVEPNELTRVSFNGARVVGDPGSVLVLNDAQFERVGLVQEDIVGCSACIHLPFGGYV